MLERMPQFLAFGKNGTVGLIKWKERNKETRVRFISL